jgi:protein-tyrosine phosphatase
MQRNLDFPAMKNARDLGGYPTVDGRVTRWNSLVRADDPSRLTPEGVRKVLDYGIRTVIDLRFEHERTSNPDPFASLDHDTRYVTCSLLGDSWENWLKRLSARDERCYWYDAYLDASQPEFRQVMQSIAGAPAGGVLFHCMAGKDRTGVVALLLLSLAGVDDAIIAADYALSAANLKAEFELNLSRCTEPATRALAIEEMRCEPEFASNTLQHLKRRYGGAKGYLRTIGLGDGVIDRLRDRLIESK